MNYELAKQLSEAGFPQECSYPSEIYSDEERGDGTIEGGFFYRKPTLSELIEACLTKKGDEIQLNIGEGSSVHKWDFSDDDGTPYSFIGRTPEEAVANLWLALNK